MSGTMVTRSAARRAVAISKASGNCPIKTIPAEMRNRIYELVLTSQSESTAKVELLEAEPPSKALLLTCRQFYEEAKQMHQVQCREYWSSTSVDISLPVMEHTYGMMIEDVRDRLENVDKRRIACSKDI